MDIKEPKLDVQYYKNNIRGYQPIKPLDTSNPPKGFQVSNIQPSGDTGYITLNKLYLNNTIYPEPYIITSSGTIGTINTMPHTVSNISGVFRNNTWSTSIGTILNGSYDDQNRLFTPEQIEELQKQLELTKENFIPKEYPLPDIMVPGLL